MLYQVLPDGKLDIVYGMLFIGGHEGATNTS